MKDRYRLVRRGNRFYAVDRHNLTRESLNTDDASAAARILAAKNKSVGQTNLNLALGRTYLSAHDPAIIERTWQNVMDEFCSRGKEQTIARRQRSMRGDAFIYLKAKRLVETTADDFRRVLSMGGAAVNLNLRCMQNLALGLGWLPAAIVPSKLWPEPKTKQERSITM